MEKKKRKRRTIDEGIIFSLYGKYYNNGHKFTIAQPDAKKFRLPRKLKKEIWKLSLLYKPNTEPINWDYDVTTGIYVTVTGKWKIRYKEDAKINRSTIRLGKLCCRMIREYYKHQNRRCMDAIKAQREMIDLLKGEMIKITGIDADLYEKIKERR